MSMLGLGPGLRPSEGAEPTEPSDSTGSLLDNELVRSKESEDGMEGTGSLICKTEKSQSPVAQWFSNHLYGMYPAPRHLFSQRSLDLT